MEMTPAQKETLHFTAERIAIYKSSYTTTQKMNYIRERFDELYGKEWKFLVVVGGEFDGFYGNFSSWNRFGYEGKQVYFFQSKHC